jgi:polar amino acid transport system substrate-binding protein
MTRLWRSIAAAVPALTLLTAGCALPRDPEKTSQRIAETRELRVGVTDNPPWTDAQTADPAGIEPDLVRQFASRIGAKVLWTRGSETALAQSLKNHELDLAIGGFDAKTPWKSIAGVSQPFAETEDKKKHVFLAAPGENRFILTLDNFLTAHMRASKRAGA